MRTVTIQLYKKDPDEWGRVIQGLNLSEKVEDAHFEFGEYATVELTIDENLQLTGRIVPLKELRR